MNPRFYFATCQAGAEKAVKAEILAELPSLRFSFSRPGFVTFKEAEGGGAPHVLERAVFVRLWGEALGQAKDAVALAALVAGLPAGACLQAFDRDQYLPGEEPPGYAPGGHIAALLSGLGLPPAGKLPRPGEAVYSLIWVDDFHVFLGRHVHTEKLSGFPGNRVDLALPPEAPSRAWLKLEEAIARFKPVVPQGAVALEVGCAPGGASTALLDRGFTVTGVDPQHVDERVFRRPGFGLLRKQARFLDEADLRRCNPDWLVMDMSIAPLEALDELAHVVGLLRKVHGAGLRLRHGFLTLKLNDRSFASSIPLYLKRVERLGFRDLRALQLCANRQEFFVWAPRFEARPGT